MGKMPMGVLSNLGVLPYDTMGILPQLGTNSFTADTGITALKYAYSNTMTI
jgi:hypothetical protein